MQLVFVLAIASAFMLARGKEREPESEQNPLLSAQRRLKRMEARVREFQKRFSPQTRRENVDGELLALTFKLRDELHAELKSFLEPATVARILPGSWRTPDDRLSGPPFALLGSLADSQESLAKDLREHDLLSDAPPLQPTQEQNPSSPDVMRARRLKIAEWRRHVYDYKVTDSLHQKLGLNLPSFESMPWYRELRRQLSKEAVSRFESGVSIEPEISVGHTPSDADILLDEIARIEQEWGLI